MHYKRTGRAKETDRIARIDEQASPNTPSHSSAQLIRWMGITDANGVGNVHGGTIMRLADEAAALAAIKHARKRVVTVSMDRMNFLVPIFVGDLVTLSATVNAAWNTSMEVGVRVEAENVRTGEVRHTNTAFVTMVALDEKGKPAAVPALQAQTPTEQRRMREAELRRANRLAERAQMRAHREQQEREPSAHQESEPSAHQESEPSSHQESEPGRPQR